MVSFGFLGMAELLIIATLLAFIMSLPVLVVVVLQRQGDHDIPGDIPVAQPSRDESLRPGKRD